jgi:hypothetical protein
MDQYEAPTFGPVDAAAILATDHRGLIALVDSGQLDTVPGRRSHQRHYRRADLCSLLEHWGQRLPDVVGSLDTPPVDGVRLSLVAEVVGFTLAQARAWIYRHRLPYYGILAYDVILSRQELTLVMERCFPDRLYAITGHSTLKSKMLAATAML